MKRLTGALLLLLTASSLASLSARAEIIEQILVKVNGDIFTKTDLEQRQIAVLRQRGQQLSDADLKNDQKLKQVLAEITPQILVDAVDELLIIQQGKELGFRMSSEQFSKTIENIKKENKIETEQQFQEALKQEGMTLEDLRRQIEKSYLIQGVQNDVAQKIQITEEEEKAYYAAHPTEFTTPAEVTLREILIEIPTITKDGQKVINAAEEERAGEQAAEIRKRIAAGEDFAKIAAEVSQAPSKANGGLVGPIKQQELAAAVQQTIAKLKPGDVSEPIRTARGYQLLKLEAVTEPAVQPFDKVKDLIADKVWAGRRQGEFTKYLKKLRTQAIIEWKNEELKRAYERQLAADATTPGPAL